MWDGVENVALQKHYAVLQAVALDRESVELPADLLMPDEEGFAKVSSIHYPFFPLLYFV